MAHKTVSESVITMTEIVMPNDTNHFGNLMGGRLMYWMDIAGAVTAMKHAESPCVTVSVDNISFKNSIKLGDIVHIEAKLTRVFNTSMEVYIKVWGEDILKKNKYSSNEAYFTFVAINENSKPVPVVEVVPEKEDERKLFDGALRRRQLRLVLAGKMKPEDANELKALFTDKD